MEFSGVQFAAPTEAVTATAPTIVPMRAPAKKKVRPWRRWAAAAAILLAIGGLAVPGWWVQRDYADAGRIVAKHQAQEDAARLRMKDAVAQIQALPEQESRKIEARRQAVRAAELKLYVVGQETAVAGAPATYEIQTTDLNSRPVPATVMARVAGADRQPVGEAIPVVKAGDGKYTLTLPADLPVKPDSRLTLVVSARRDDLARRPRSAATSTWPRPSTSRTSTPTSRCISPARSCITGR